MSGEELAQLACPNCGHSVPLKEHTAPQELFRPWYLGGRRDVHAYVSSLGDETHEWLLALFVTKELHLLAVDTISRGTVSECKVSFRRILCRGAALNAAGFVLVHNHPSGDPRPSEADIRVTRRLSRISRELDMPFLDHFIVAGDQMMSVGIW